MSTQKIIAALIVVIIIFSIAIVVAQKKNETSSAPVMEDVPIDTSQNELDDLAEQMKGFPCHQMGGVWMGQCEFDAQGNPTNVGEGENFANMMGEIATEEFSHDTEGLPPVVPTKIVKIRNGDTFDLTAEIVAQEVGNRTVKRLAYNRQIPGPIIEVEKGASVTVNLTNKIDVPTTLHSHGLRLDDAFDGVPFDMGGTQDEIMPGESFSYTLTFPDTGVYWYHPHVREDYTQELGLYGNFSVTEEGYWNDVDAEEFLVLDDFSQNDPFYKDVTNKTLMGRFGDILLINNKTDYRFSAQQGDIVRFSLTNTANTRTFDIKIPGAKMKLVGGDVGRSEKEEFVERIIIAPAERYIIEVLFDAPGKYAIDHRGEKMGTIEVVEDSDQQENTFAQLRTNAADYIFVRNNMAELLAREPDKKLRATIDIEGMRGGGMMGGGMRGMMSGHGDGELHDADDGIEWEDDMKMMNNMSNSEGVTWKLVDEKTSKENRDMSEDWIFEKGEMVKVEIFNDPESLHPMQHPIHFHGQRFVVLSRDGKANDNLQWKDTALIRTGEKVEILIEMSNPGKWIAHCHIAEHMHAGMMFNFDVRE